LKNINSRRIFLRMKTNPCIAMHASPKTIGQKKKKKKKEKKLESSVFE